MGKAGRPKKHYTTSWGETVVGLGRASGGRWRNLFTGERWTERDERQAVAKFRAMELAERRGKVAVPVSPTQGPLVPRLGAEGVEVLTPDLKKTIRMLNHWPPESRGNITGLTAELDLPEADVWAFFRKELIANPAKVAKLTSIPELAALAHLPLPKPSIRLDDLLAIHWSESGTTQQHRKLCAVAVKRLRRCTQAETLADLTNEKLLEFRKAVDDDPKLLSIDSKRQVFTRIKQVISFGLKLGMDAVQIRQALDRCKVLWLSGKSNPKKPTPIKPDEWRTLLAEADRKWRAILLVGLNCGLHLGEVSRVRWKHFDLKARTYSAPRGKTGILQSAMLWPETVSALKEFPRLSDDWVFASTKTLAEPNRSTLTNLFRRFADRLKLPNLTFESIRDGAFSVAVKVDQTGARVLIGHASPGDTDAYLAREPKVTAKVCRAVYNVYMR